ncbi:hypothetical protein J22TS3_01310 [Paenibacillus sp. J22TS3]|nr:hypothetical protein J22TS3_01310 [Paenibacillus sp. J22TS3]
MGGTTEDNPFRPCNASYIGAGMIGVFFIFKYDIRNDKEQAGGHLSPESDEHAEIIVLIPKPTRLGAVLLKPA